MKNLLFSSALLLLSSAAIAQLYVAPNGANESYIYVKDQVLFVEQDVNLTENTASADKKASIYLRDGSQLIQGASNGTNSGDGYISVYQDSRSDAYDYNYWCSPVGNPNATGNRNFGVARFHDIVTNTDSNLAAVTGGRNGSSSPLTISTQWLYRWIPSTQRWSAIGTGNNVPVGYGFTMKGTDITYHSDPFSDPQNQVYDFRGRPNNGDITLPTQTGVNWNGIQYDFTLTGNPYPSALDLNKVFIDNTNIDSFKYWDEDRSVNSHYYVDNKGGYGTWIPGPGDPYVTGGVYSAPTFMSYDNSGNPTTPSGGTGAVYGRLYAPIGQGFMVMALDNSGITLKNSHRVYEKEGADSEFNLHGGGNSGGTSRTMDLDGQFAPEIPTLRIYTTFGESHYRDLVLMFDDAATDDYDRGLDASHPMDGAISDSYFTIHANQPDVRKNLVIQTVPFDDPHKRIAISFKIGEQMTVNVKAAEEINIPYLKAYLFDSLNNTYQLISDDPSQIGDNGANVLLPAGTYEGRFFITFRTATPQDDDEEGLVAKNENQRVLENLDFFQNNPAQQLEVGNKEGYEIISANIFDMSGKRVYTNNNVGNSSRFTFPTGNLSDGLYVVMLTTKENIDVNYKITVQNR
jgi:hypothetical protein